MRLSIGKPPLNIIRDVVYKYLGVEDYRVLVGPSIGEDAAIIDLGDHVLAVHSDPITGAVKHIGWLAVNIAANDIASRGISPRWLSLTLLLPEGCLLSDLEDIMRDIDRACRYIGLTVIGGHTEVTLGFSRPVIICTVIGEGLRKNFVKTGGGRAGDKLILTKGCGIEGTAILSYELEYKLKNLIGLDIVENGKTFFNYISVVKEALKAVGSGGVTAMHDVTEGGVATCIQEMALASNLGVIAYEDKMIIKRETAEICKALKIDPLMLIGSGALLIAAKRNYAESIVKDLMDEGIESSIIGELIDNPNIRVVKRINGEILNLNNQLEEQLYKVVEFTNV
ncbi:MAG: AIR synthase family protein [Candidatus Methanomethylicia archaeon]